MLWYQLKLNNSIVLNDFYKNIEELVDKSNEEFKRQHYHITYFISDYDMQDLSNILFKS